MTYEEFKERVININGYNDADNIIFVTPDGTVCRDIKLSLSNKYRNDLNTDIIVTLINTDSCTHPVEDDTHLALDAVIARQNVQIYNHNTYHQIKEIDNSIINASKKGFDYYERWFNKQHESIVDVINKHYSALGFDICVDKIKDMYKVLIQW